MVSLDDLMLVVGAFLAWKFIEEYLAVRAPGSWLCSRRRLSFLRPESTRLLLMLLAYAAKTPRFRAAVRAGILYSGALIVCVALLWK